MSTTSSTQHGADTQAKRAASANTRFARAFRAGEAALKGTLHSGALLLYYKYLVARCGDGTGCNHIWPPALEQPCAACSVTMITSKRWA